MDHYSEWEHQESIKRRLESRNNGFVPVELAGNETIPQMFDRQLINNSHNPAIVSRGKATTYLQLGRLSCDIGRAIDRVTHGKQPPVAILVADHAKFVASSLGVLRAGGVYIPLDPAFPEARNAFIAGESAVQIILTERIHQQLAERLASPGQRLLYVDEMESGGDECAGSADPGDLACIIFTSGSAGRPKGVLQTHASVLQIARRYASGLYLGSRDRVSLLSSCSVIASVGTILSSLLSGATLFPFSVREEGLGALADWLDAEQITLYRSVPSLFRHLMNGVAQDRVFSGIQIVRLGGESLYRSDWEMFKRHCPPDSVMVNGYGCSEMSSVSRYYLDHGSRLEENVVPVGYPLPDVEIAVAYADGSEEPVLDRPGRLHKPSAVGEIVLKSRWLSPGYWNEVVDNAAASATMRADNVRTYKTGDLGAVRADQGLVHVGREDSQVKLSGFRVEIAEVEACLRSHPDVKEAAVIVHALAGGERELVGFTVVRSGNVGAGEDIRAYVSNSLPPYMVPSVVVPVEGLPCTPNGKINRSALIALRESSLRVAPRRDPLTRTEERLARIWAQILSVEAVGVEDNFFALGGNSLRGMSLIVKIADSFCVQLPALAVMQNPTIRQMSRHIDRLLPATRQPAVAGGAELEEGTI